MWQEGHDCSAPEDVAGAGALSRRDLSCTSLPKLQLYPAAHFEL